jgi:hypothetical protein
VPKRLNRITRTIVMVAGLVVIGGSAVGGIALAANRTDGSPNTVAPHVTPTRSADDHNSNRGNDSTSDDEATATPSTSCTEDRDDDDATPTNGTGDRHGDAEAPEDTNHHGDATPTTTGGHRADADTDHTRTHDAGADCDDHDD